MEPKILITGPVDATIADSLHNMIQAHIFQHYKGGLYRALGVALDTVSERLVVIYQPLVPKAFPIYTRPWNEFVGLVSHPGEPEVHRFMDITDTFHDMMADFQAFIQRKRG